MSKLSWTPVKAFWRACTVAHCHISRVKVCVCRFFFSQKCPDRGSDCALMCLDGSLHMAHLLHQEARTKRERRAIKKLLFPYRRGGENARTQKNTARKDLDFIKRLRFQSLAPHVSPCCGHAVPIFTYNRI